MLRIICIEIKIAVPDIQSHRPEFMLLNAVTECCFIRDINLSAGFERCKQCIDIIDIIFIKLLRRADLFPDI